LWAIGIGIVFVAGLAIGAAPALLDPDTKVSFGIPKIGFVFEKSASASSPFAKCKEKETTLEAILAGNNTNLARVSSESLQLAKRADETAMQFAKDGIIRVPYAQDVGGCESLHSSIVAPNEASPSYKRPSHICSSLLDEQIRDVQEKKQEYSALQKVQAQTSAELDQLQQECFGPKK
jgi:hypothetical protein